MSVFKFLAHGNNNDMSEVVLSGFEPTTSRLQAKRFNIVTRPCSLTKNALLIQTALQSDVKSHGHY